MRISTNKLERQKIDKSQWARGEWTDEPDYISWHAPGLYRCKAVRHSYMGHWCGYVGLPEGYVLACDVGELEVHGGITYDQTNKKPNGVELKGRWLGLDCAHSTDYSPNLYSKDFDVKHKLQLVYRNKDLIPLLLFLFLLLRYRGGSPLLSNTPNQYFSSIPYTPDI